MKRIGALFLGVVCSPVLGLVPTCAAEPVVAAFVLDTSGSVGKPGIAKTRELAVKILAGLPAGSEVAVFTFDDQARLLLPRTQQPESVRRALSTLTLAGRRTALHDALYDASRYLRDVRGRGAIVLITDGRDEGSALNLDDGLRVAEEAHIPIFTVGVGKVEERVLRRIAKLTGGQYVTIETAKGSSISADISSATARMAYSAAGGAGTSAAAPDAAAPPTSGSAVSGGPATKGAGAPPTPTETISGIPGSKASASKPPQAASSRSSFWIWAGLVIAAGAGVALFAMHKRRGAHRCNACGRELPSALASCAFCVASSPRGAAGDRTLKADLSPTVLARLNDTAEFLEKTISLREKPVLSVTRGPGMGQLFELNEELATLIGRAKANDIVLQDVSVSSQHCKIWPENGTFVLHDLQSTNGTFVNEKRVAHHTLSDGDIVQVGETFLQFHTEHRRV